MAKVIFKTIKDYYQQLYDKYPQVPEKDIRTIVNFGWRSLYLHNSYGCDVRITDQNFLAHFGKMTKNSLKHYYYYRNKLVRKLRILYKRRKMKWDGYYYFALTKKQYDEFYGSKIHKRGRPTKKFTFYDIDMFKIKEECMVARSFSRYIFRIKYIEDIGWRFKRKKFTTDKAELILTREPLKLRDMLTSNYKYEILHGRIDRTKRF